MVGNTLPCNFGHKDEAKVLGHEEEGQACWGRAPLRHGGPA